MDDSDGALNALLDAMEDEGQGSFSGSQGGKSKAENSGKKVAYLENRVKELERQLASRGASTKTQPSTQTTPVSKTNVPRLFDLDTNIFAKKAPPPHTPQNLHSSTSRDGKSPTLKDIGLSESSEDEEDYAPNLSKSGRALKRKLDARAEDERTAKRNTRNSSPDALVIKRTAFAPLVAPSPASQTVARKETVSSKVVTAKCQFSGYNIANPMISPADLAARIGDKQTCKLSQIAHSGLPFGKMDWITFAVLLTKLPTKTSASGKQFSIWKMMDLEDSANSVTLFLFGDAHSDSWRVQASNVVVILNASILPKKDDKSGLSLSVNSYNQIIELGYAADLGHCKGQTKNGESCKNLINKTKQEYCVYHLKAAFQKISSQRMDIQTNYSGVQPRMGASKIAEVAYGYFYGGKLFTAPRSVSEVKKPPPTTFKTQISKGAQALIDESRQLIRKQLSEAEKVTLERVTTGNEELNELVVNDGPGARNLVKSIAKEDLKKHPRKYVSPSELLKSQEVSMKNLIEQHKKRVMNKNVTVPKLSGSLGGGGVVFSDAGRTASLKAPPVPISQVRAIAQLRQSGKKIPKSDPNCLSRNPSTVSRTPFSSSAQTKNTDMKICNLQDDPEIQALLQTTSRHDDLCQLNEIDFMDKYFSHATMKESIETQMEDTKDIECDVVVCKKCDYMAHSLAKRCQEERHPFTRQKVKKRFVKCRKCTRRKPTFKAVSSAVSPCKSCGSQNYQWCGMLPFERKGPTLDTEKLLIRGEEEPKFLNSLV
ncbi:protein MCM10 homolog [Paramacrobiotus metropolitanus]|uniref:protein MCM10 homolog n=1 Tax=Paramacrobiotus metropolitanus TaxID=2943436 RepID=UPI002445DC8D|nr:protein MCM10 homolog [Paramacrobiotus metropolitanus]